MKHHGTLLKHCETWNTLKTVWNITKHSALNAETLALGTVTSRLARQHHARCDDIVLAAMISPLVRSFWQHRRGVFSDISDCRVGITPQMFNRVTNHGDMCTFSKPGPLQQHYSLLFAVRMAAISDDAEAIARRQQFFYLYYCLSSLQAII